MMMPDSIFALAAWIAVGLAFGLLYFAALQRTVGLFSASRARLVPLALTFTRIAAAILFFAVSVRFGALPLLASFLGFLAARGLVLRAARRAA